MDNRIGKHGEKRPATTISGAPVTENLDRCNLAQDGYYVFLDRPLHPDTLKLLDEINASLTTKAKPNVAKSDS